MPTNLGAKIAKGVALGGINLAVSAVMTLVATPWILRELGEINFGLYGLLLASFGVMNLLSLGGQDATLYYSSKEGSESHTQTLGLWHLGIALLGALALWLLGQGLGLGERLGLKGEEASAFDLSLAAAGLCWAAQFFVNWLWTLCRAELRFGLLTASQAFVSIAAPFAGIAAAHLWGGLSAFLWGQSAVWLVSGLGIPFFMQRPFRFGGTMPLREIWAYARWSLLISLSIVALQSSDRFFTVAFGASAVAAYSIASSLYQRGTSAFGLVPTLLMPAISRMEGDSPDRAKRAYDLSLRFGVMLALAGFLPLLALGDAFLKAWLPGHDELCARAFFPLQLLSVAGCVGSLSLILHSVLLGLGRAKQVALSGLAGTAIGYLVAWLMLPSLGFAAAAICGLSGYFSVYVIRIWVSERRVFGRPLLPILGQHLLLVAGAAVLVFLLRPLSALVMGRGLAITLAAMLGSAAFVAFACFAADALMGRWKGQESVYQALLTMSGRGR